MAASKKQISEWEKKQAEQRKEEIESLKKLEELAKEIGALIGYKLKPEKPGENWIRKIAYLQKDDFVIAISKDSYKLKSGQIQVHGQFPRSKVTSTTFSTGDTGSICVSESKGAQKIANDIVGRYLIMYEAAFLKNVEAIKKHDAEHLQWVAWTRAMQHAIDGKFETYRDGHFNGYCKEVPEDHGWRDIPHISGEVYHDGKIDLKIDRIDVKTAKRLIAFLKK